MQASVHEIAAEDERALRQACRLLEHPSLAARLTALLGAPIEQGMRLLPRDWHVRLHAVLHGTVARLLELAIVSWPFGGLPPGRSLHTSLGAATGALAGLFGLPAVLIELPISTAIMLHGIAAVAKSQGENLGDVAARAECIKVFALGGHPSDDDAAETGYYGLRFSLALHFAPVLGVRAGLPSSVGFVRTVSTRFGFAVSDKAAAQLVPVFGSVSAGLVNALFVHHFHDVAWGHFTVRRLERIYGEDVIRAAYGRIAAEEPGAGAGKIT